MNTMGFVRRATASTAALAAAATLTIAGSVPANASTGESTYTIATPVPATCSNGMTTVDHSGDVGEVLVEGRTLTWSLDEGNLGFQPLDLQWYGGMGSYGDEDNYFAYNSATTISPDGQLVDVTHQETVEGGVVLENSWTENRRWGNGWQNTEDFTKSGTKLYRLTPDGYLFRYDLPDATRKVQVFSNARSVRTVAFDRTIDWKGGKADVLLASLSGGALREYVIPHADPTNWSSRTLRTSGWGAFRQFDAVSCGEKGRLIMGYLDDRRIAVYYDPNRYDFDASDLRGRATPMPALQAGTLAYG
ncbi:MAG: hypothetical protein QJR09_12080 [Micrococcus sp.]|nr:hypothetical protein [Micrococcus sp.]